MKEDNKERSEWKEAARRQEREETEEDEKRKREEETNKNKSMGKRENTQEQIARFRPSKPPPLRRRKSPEKTTRSGGRIVKGLQETSIDNGETIRPDWGTWSQRE